jgi:hypothetical protein
MLIGNCSSHFNTIAASAEKSIAANSPAKNLGYAAAAIIAALSVDSGREGKYTKRPSWWRLSRTAVATPDSLLRPR